MIRVAVVDDDASVLKNIGKLIKRTKAFEGFEYIIDTFTSGSDFLHSEKFYDLLLLDIEMPQMNGFELAKQVNSVSQDGEHTSIIYISNYENLVFESFKYSPLRFVRKNNLNTDFPEAVSAFLSKYQSETNFFSFIERDSNACINVKLMDIMYFESFGHEIYLIEKGGKTYIIKRSSDCTMSELEEKYSDYGFIRSHKSYLVNYRHIYSIKDNKIYFENDKIALISIRNVKEFKIRYQSLVMKERI